MIPGYADCPRRACIPIIRAAAEETGYTFHDTPQGIGAAVGTGLHAGARYALEEKQAGRAVSKNDAEERSVCNLRETIKTGVQWDPTTPEQNTAERQLRTLARSFVDEVAPAVTPVIIESRRRAKFLDGVTISGQPDVEEPGAISDWKAGSKLGSHHGQLGAYSLLKRGGEGGTLTRLSVWHLPRVPARKPYPGARRHDLDVNVCERAAWATIQHIIRDVRQFTETKDPWAFQANPGSMLCSYKYCRAFGTSWCELTAPRATVSGSVGIQ